MPQTDDLTLSLCVICQSRKQITTIPLFKTTVTSIETSIPMLSKTSKFLSYVCFLKTKATRVLEGNSSQENKTFLTNFIGSIGRWQKNTLANLLRCMRVSVCANKRSKSRRKCNWISVKVRVQATTVVGRL